MNVLRHEQPVERLCRKDFDGPHKGLCRHCKTEDGEPGIIKMMRNPQNGKLLPYKCPERRCGQRYRVSLDDLEVFLGYHPSAEGIPGVKFRSVFDEWEPSDKQVYR